VLKEVLKKIAEGEALSLRELAYSLGLSEEMLKAMLDDLERMGYLTSRVPDCSFRCEGCPLKSSCKVAGVERLWFITEKGLKATQTLH
jgi:biotin operon repressor